MIDFQTHPDRYKHWQLSFAGRVAYLTMNVDTGGGLQEGYELKMNSYDLGVDIELYDAVQRLRFEHPEVGAVVVNSALERIFCAGANIRMLGTSTHAHKVNFCKFTNETRNSIEDATAQSSQRYMAAINGVAAGGGYELALATDYIMLVDDGNAAVSLPEVPLLAVLPGTGGLTRVVDKRKVRRDLADVFCTVEEGVRGERARKWRLVDELVPTSKFAGGVAQRAAAFAAETDRPEQAQGIPLEELPRVFTTEGVEYTSLGVTIDENLRIATLDIRVPNEPVPADLGAALALGAKFWPLQLARDFDDALLHLRTNETGIGTLVLKTIGSVETVSRYETLLAEHASNWWFREITLFWKRCLKRLDVTSRTTIALVEPGSCFCGWLVELAFASDRIYMLDGNFEDATEEEAVLRLSEFNFGQLPMANGLSRLETRFLGEPKSLGNAKKRIGEDLLAIDALNAGLVTYAPDDIDWEDEIRLLLEERASYSPDSLTGMEANLRFAGPETMETKIFARLSAWQNWIFQRPNAVGEEGALRLYGTGIRPRFNIHRV